MSTKRRRMAQEIAEVGQHETPYGLVIKPLDLGLVIVPCICPHALLWIMCELSVEYRQFLAGCLHGGDWQDWFVCR